MKISDYIKSVREELNMTQAQFAALIGTTRCCIADYETDRSEPKASLLLKIQAVEQEHNKVLNK